MPSFSRTSSPSISATSTTKSEVSHCWNLIGSVFAFFCERTLLTGLSGFAGFGAGRATGEDTDDDTVILAMLAAVRLGVAGSLLLSFFNSGLLVAVFSPSDKALFSPLPLANCFFSDFLAFFFSLDSTSEEFGVSFGLELLRPKLGKMDACLRKKDVASLLALRALRILGEPRSNSENVAAFFEPKGDMNPLPVDGRSGVELPEEPRGGEVPAD